MVLAEAMAVGCPVIASRVGGVPFMVADGETGLLYDVGDVAALARLLRRLFTDPTLCVRLSQQAQAQARSMYACKRVAAATVDAYRFLLDQAEIGIHDT